MTRWPPSTRSWPAGPRAPPRALLPRCRTPPGADRDPLIEITPVRPAVGAVLLGGGEEFLGVAAGGRAVRGTRQHAGDLHRPALAGEGDSRGRRAVAAHRLRD